MLGALVVVAAVAAFVVTRRHDAGPAKPAAEQATTTTDPSATDVPERAKAVDVDRAATRATDAGLDDPRKGTMPPVEQRQATVDLLHGDGAVLLTAMVEADRLLAATKLSKATCTAIATDLDAVGTPPDLTALAGDIPDEATREMLVNVVSATVGVLKTCDAGSRPHTGQAVGTLGFELVVAERRMQQLGVR